MIRFLRILAVLLIVVGAIIILTWTIEPLREIWPFAIEWFRSLPAAIQLGLAIAAVGFVILFTSVVWERMEDRRAEGNLLDD